MPKMRSIFGYLTNAAKVKYPAPWGVANLVLLVAGYLTMAGVGLAVTKPMLRLLHTPEVLMGDAAAYMSIIMGGLVVVTAYHTPFSILRALGDSKTLLIFLGICSGLNIILDIVFVVPMDVG